MLALKKGGKEVEKAAEGHVFPKIIKSTIRRKKRIIRILKI